MTSKIKTCIYSGFRGFVLQPPSPSSLHNPRNATQSPMLPFFSTPTIAGKQLWSILQNKRHKFSSVGYSKWLGGIPIPAILPVRHRPCLDSFIFSPSKLGAPN